MRNLSLLIVAAISLLSATNLVAQAVPVEGKRIPHAAKEEARIRQVSNDAGKYFKLGLESFVAGRRDDARADFDRAVEIFLMSGINVQRDRRLRECYNELIETVYRLEFPTSRQPANLYRLSVICNWEIKSEHIGRVESSIGGNSPNDEAALASAASGVLASEDDEVPVGFAEQTFEPSPFDELSRVVLSLERPESEMNTYRVIGVSDLAKIRAETLARSKMTAGPEPRRSRKGTVQAVLNFIDENYHNPYSVKYLKWSSLELVALVDNKGAWKISLKHRARNVFNAYVLTTTYFYIRNGRVVATSSEDISVPPDSDYLSEMNRRANRLEKIADQLRPGSAATTYSRPDENSAQVEESGVRVVKAKSGETVKSLAARFGVSAVEVAKMNGLYVNSRLNAGREIRIPVGESRN